MRALIPLSIALMSVSAFAGGYSTSNVQLLSGDGYKLNDSKQMETLTYENISSWEYGDHYFFVDMFNKQDGKTAVYTEWTPTLSLSKATGKSFQFGPIKDVHLAASVNIGSPGDFRALLWGAGVDLDVPGFKFFRLQGFSYKANNDKDATYQITPSWDAPIKVFNNLDMRFRGYLDYVGEGAGGRPYVLFDPQLLVDVGKLLGSSDKVFAGVEYRYWWNKYGVKGETESVPQAMLMWQW